jgi:uncharacterized protein YbjT (DUF2867 family)
MFAVTGATGKVGGAVARALGDAGKTVRVVLRDPGKADTWAARGCEIAVADSSDETAMTKAFSGVEGAFVMLPSNFDPTPGFPEARAVIDVLRASLFKAQPSKVVVLSTIGADASQPNLLNQLGLLERALADLPVPVTFLRAAWFMENAAWDVSAARTDGVIASYLQPLDKVFPMIATDDVGRAAAKFLLEGWTGHRVVDLEGPHRVSPHAIAEAFAHALGSPVEAQIVPRDSWEALFRSQGMHNPTPRMQMLDGFNEGWIDFEGRDTHSHKGTVTIDQVIAALVANAATTPSS